MTENEKRHRKRSKQINLRVTPEEWQTIKSLYERMRKNDIRGESMPFNAWAINMLQNGYVNQIVVAIEPAAIRGMIGEIGNNINQIARVANTTMSFEEPQMRRLQEQFGQLWDIFLKLNDDYNDLVASRE